MTEPGMRDFELTFTRIGRCNAERGGAAMTLAVAVDDGPATAVADEIAEHAYEHARPHIRSSDFEVVVRCKDGADVTTVDAPLDGAKGLLIVGGFRSAGEFTVREVTAR